MYETKRVSFRNINLLLIRYYVKNFMKYNATPNPD